MQVLYYACCSSSVCREIDTADTYPLTGFASIALYIDHRHNDGRSGGERNKKELELRPVNCCRKRVALVSPRLGGLIFFDIVSGKVKRDPQDERWV